MALTGSLEVPPELLELFQKLISPANSTRSGAVRKHGYLQSRQKIANLTNRSLLPQIRDMRESLSPLELQRWKNAALAGRQNWWNLFVQDTAYRIKYGLPGLADPSELHQYKVGRIEIEAPAKRVLLTQYHPSKYWVSKKNRGNTSIRQDVAVIERLRLPLLIGTSYRSNLSAVGDEPRVRVYAIVTSQYQGRNIETEVSCDLARSTAWTTVSAVCNEVIGTARDYQLFIELNDVQGSFEWDNFNSRHTGMNWARDWRCSDVNNELTRVNYQIEKSWEELFLPYKTAFDSVYPADTELP